LSHHNHKINHYNSAFAFGIALNTVFVVIEAGYGVKAGSLALIADAGHNLSDVFSLLLAWGASLLAMKDATDKRTYGFRKTTIIASLASSLLLLAALGAIAWEAIGKLFNPTPIEGNIVIIVAAIGVAINMATALLFASGQKDDLNIKAVFLHMTTDAAVSLGVVVAGIIIVATGWLLIDPLMTLFIVAVVLGSAWSLLRESMNLSIDSVPKQIDMTGIKEYLSGLKNVSQMHDLHVWPLSTTEVALSVHLIISEGCSLNNNFLSELQKHLHDCFGIEHSTIQIERENDAPCMMLDRKGCI